MKNVVAIDLFCGIGGLTYGLQNSGIKVTAGIDLDESCRETYEKNNSAVFLHKNISELNGKELLKYYDNANADVKILAGCAPCQPFSQHQKNKKNRKKHKDWGLLYEFLRIIDEVNPDIVSMENVPDLEREDVFVDFTNGLKKSGYNVTYKIHNAADYGVPQRRNRLLLLASKKGKIEFLKKTQKMVTVRKAIGNLKPINAGEKNENYKIHISPTLSKLNLERIRQSKPGGSWKDWDKSLLPECYKKKSGSTYSSVYGRMEWDNVAPTLTTQFNRYGTGRFGHPEQDRALTLREGAILQSFPKNYKFISRDGFLLTRIARHIGNAVPPKLAKHIGKSIIEHVNNFYK